MIKKYNIFIKFAIFPLFILITFCSFYVQKDNSKRKVKIIVIDPGHGGKDPGCNGVTCKEKEVALAVALKFGKLIEDKLKDVKVIYTRTTDVFVELEDRAKIANENNADLFISIHCNAAGKAIMIKDKKTGKMRAKTYKNKKGRTVVVETSNPEPFGSETYVMGLKNEEGKMKVAQRENSAMLLEDNYETKYQGFDPNSEESYIIMSNYTSSYVIQSAGLALKIQEQYFKKAGRVDKGVHRQSIWVLWRTSMPSVLTEIGYLTNPQEEKFLGSEKGQTHLAACLFRAFRKYKDEQEGIKINYNDDLENQPPLENENYKMANEAEEAKLSENSIDKPDDESDVEIKKEDKIKTLSEAELKLKEKLAAEQKLKEEAKLQKVKADSILQVQNKLINVDEKKYKQWIALADVNLKKKNYEEALILYKKANDLKIRDETYSEQKIKEIEVISQNINEKETKSNLSSDSLKTIDNATAELIYKIQFASSDKEIDAKSKFPNVTDVSFYKKGEIFKYTSGNFKTMDEAVKQQTKLRELGYKDCFLAVFKNGVRVDASSLKK